MYVLFRNISGQYLPDFQRKSGLDVLKELGRFLTEDPITFLFRMGDANCDNKLTAEEMMQSEKVFRRISRPNNIHKKGRCLSKEHCERMKQGFEKYVIKPYDENGDDMIDFVEFSKYMHTF